MPRRIGTVVTVGAAVLALVAQAATANRSLSTTTTRLEAIGSAVSFRSEAMTLICEVTLSSTLNRTWAKTRGSVIGSITDARANERGCRSSLGTGTPRVRFNRNQPWQTTMNSFTGTLPNITSILETVAMIDFLIEIEVFGLRTACLYSVRNVGLASSGERFTRGVFLLPNRGTLIFALAETLAACPPMGELNGELNLVPRTLTLL